MKKIHMYIYIYTYAYMYMYADTYIYILELHMAPSGADLSIDLTVEVGLTKSFVK